MKRILLKKLVYIYTLFFLVSCNYQEGPTDISDYDSIITNYNADKEAVFATSATFCIPDYVVHIGEDSTVEHITTSIDELIIAQTILNMENLGYKLVEEDENTKPDLIVLPYTYDVLIVESYTYWPGYWNGYWGGYWGWYGIGYPYYAPSMTTYYAYNKGTVILEIVENKAIEKEGDFPILWQGILNGIQTNTIDHQNRVSEGIDQLFLQSPYLGIK